MEKMLELMGNYGESQIVSTALICLILVFVVNHTGLIDNRWLPAVATLIGAAVGLAFSVQYGSVFYSVGLGIIGGFASSGAYDFVKATFFSNPKKDYIDHKKLDEEFTPPEGE